MGKAVQFNLEAAVGRWCRQIKSIPSITESDSEEYKYALLDMVDDFKSKGLDDEEAFCIASGRFNEIYNLQEDFEEVNIASIQMRRIVQVLSGTLIYFLLYFLMHSSSKIIFLKISLLRDFTINRVCL